MNKLLTAFAFIDKNRPSEFYFLWYFWVAYVSCNFGIRLDKT